MAYSKPIFQNIVYTNGTLFAALYLRSYKNDVNGSEDDQFYWINSTSVGVVEDKRNNALNSYFTSLSGALSTPPTGYSAITAPTDIYENKRIWCYTQGYPFESQATLARTLTEYDDHIASGGNCIMVQIGWDEVFQTYSAQTTNADSSWTKFDGLIDYIAAKTTLAGDPVFVRLRIKTSMDDGTHYDLFGATNTSGFYGLSQSAIGTRGFPTRIGYGTGHVSLAYSTGVNQALNFVQKCVDRYNTRLGSQLLDVSVVNTAQFEAGYNYENQHYYYIYEEDGTTHIDQQWIYERIPLSPYYRYVLDGGGFKIPSGQSSGNATVNTDAYPETYDYSTYSIAGFRTWIASLPKYDTIAKVNTAWGEVNGDYSDIQPPTVASGATATQLNAIFATTKGQDWWLWNYKLIKDYQVACKSIVATYAPDAKFFLEWGSCTDDLAIRRMSLNVADMASFSDMMKAQFGLSANKPNLALTLDVIRTNYSKKIGTELNSYDMRQQYGATDSNQVKNTMIEFGQNCILNGAMDIMFISSKDNQSDFTATMDAMKVLIAYSTNHSGRINGVKDITYNLGQILNSPNFLKNTWSSNGGSNGQRINMIQTTDLIIPPSGGCPNSIQIYPIAQLCLSDLQWRSNDFNNSGPSTQGDNRPPSEFQINYNNTKIKLFLPTHSIDRLSSSGVTSKCNWKVIGVTDGLTYISNIQFDGVFNDNTEGLPYGNNHPNNYYNLNLPVDATFYLPLGQKYRIEMTTTTVKAVTFIVEQLDPNVELHKVKLNGLTTLSYEIDTENIQKSAIKTVKINCNRTSETDSL